MSTLTIDQGVPGHWRVTIDNPPINTANDAMFDELFDLVEALEVDSSVKVVTFESANADFFVAHYGIGEAVSRFGRPRWREASARLARIPAVSIASIRGRARGVGSEMALACDLRFASLERAVFGQPEVGFGIIPGGGALERLPLLIGRSRAIEVALGGDDFDAATAERYGWINRALPEAELDAFVANFVRRILHFDAQALAATKSILNQSLLASDEQLASTEATFGEALRWPRAIELLTKAREQGLGRHSDFELEMGERITEL